MGNGILEVAMALIGVALIALLVGRAEQTSQVVTSAGTAFNNLLKTVSLQNGMSVNY